jgi:uncharacterized protein (TIGR03435 family)
MVAKLGIPATHETPSLIDGSRLPLCLIIPGEPYMITALLLQLTLLAVLTPASQQQTSASAPATAFDVVSIKPSDPNNRDFAIKPQPNNFTMTGASLKFLIQVAYDLHDFQIEGAPAWMSSARFDILAKVEPPSTPAESQDWDARQKLLQLRLQSLLADRFKLRAHKGTKEMPVYGLVVAKGGPKLQASTKNTGYTSGRGQFICSDTSMDDLASMLSGEMNRSVLDLTKLTGGYAFTLKWTPDDGPTTDLPGIFTAIQEQLGLKLVPTKGPVAVLLIDHVEMPSEN